MVLHVDGARMSNAAAALGVSFKEMITDTGVDICSFGGTKNGLLLGEMVIVVNPDAVKGVKYLRKSSMQLASKMRFVSAQFLALLSLSLCIINLLPIPILDGGHLLYYLIELVKGSPLSERAMAAGQFVGLAFLAGLMGLALYNDILRPVS